MVVRVIGALRPGVTFGPRREVIAEGVGPIREAVGLVDRALSFGLSREGASAAIPGGLGDVVLAVAAGVARNPDHLPGGVAALDRRLAPHAASSRFRARKSSTSAGR